MLDDSSKKQLFNNFSKIKTTDISNFGSKISYEVIKLQICTIFSSTNYFSYSCHLNYLITYFREIFLDYISVIQLHLSSYLPYTLNFEFSGIWIFIGYWQPSRLDKWNYVSKQICHIHIKTIRMPNYLSFKTWESLYHCLRHEFSR